MNSHSRLAISTVAVLLGFTTFAHAGPPLICHPIEIGQAKSLPWIEFNHKGSTDYDLKNLSRDTLAILDSNTPVLVHMETLRRATIYARQDPKVAKELVTRLQARAANSDAAGRPCVVRCWLPGRGLQTMDWQRRAQPRSRLRRIQLGKKGNQFARVGSGNGIRGCLDHAAGLRQRSPGSHTESDGRGEDRSSSRSEPGLQLQPSDDCRASDRRV